MVILGCELEYCGLSEFICFCWVRKCHFGTHDTIRVTVPSRVPILLDDLCSDPVPKITC